MKRVLVAGIGNIFFGDDAFGWEVARELMQRSLPQGVQVVDFGIRSYDLACALTERYDAIILVDVTQRGGAVGTTYLIEIDPAEIAQLEPRTVIGHDLDLARVLQMARGFGEISGRLYLVGCEPAILETDSGDVGLSQTVRQAMPQALAMIDSLLQSIFEADLQQTADLVLK